MRQLGRIYGRLLIAGFRRQSTYRLAALGGLAANLTFGLLKLAILSAAVRTTSGDLGGYDLATMSAYIWISQGLLGSVNLYGRLDLVDRVKTGDVAVEFLRPIDLQAATLATELGRGLFTLLPRGLPLLLVGILVGMSGPSGWLGWLAGPISLVLGMLTSYAMVYLIAVAGFWLVDVRGIQMFYMAVAGFLGGLFVPIWIFPGWLTTLAVATPFPAMLMYPVDVLSGRAEGLEIVGLLAAQAGWLLVLLAVGQALTRAGRRVLEVQGG